MNAVSRERTAIQSRRGFTLVELVVVLLIILIMAGLLLSAVAGIQRRRDTAKAFFELNALAKALDTFKQEKGVYPPSRIYLIESGDYSPANTSGLNCDLELVARSVRYLKAIFPKIRLRVRDTDPAVAEPYDFNGNGNTTEVFELFGDQCLVFFLGGVPNQVNFTVANTPVLQGFVDIGPNPAPDQDTVSPDVTRKKYYDFSTMAGNRLVWKATAEPETDHLDATFVAALPMPVLNDISAGVGDMRAIFYFSAYEGQGYRPGDGGPVYNGGQPTEPTYGMPTPPQIRMQEKWAATGMTTTNTGSAPEQHQLFAGPNPYTRTRPNPDPAWYPPPEPAVAEFYKPETFQLITPGSDGIYGPGGALPPQTVFNAGDPNGSFRSNDATHGGSDNITNFVTTQLSSVTEPGQL